MHLGIRANNLMDAKYIEKYQHMPFQDFIQSIEKKFVNFYSFKLIFYNFYTDILLVKIKDMVHHVYKADHSNK